MSRVRAERRCWRRSCRTPRLQLWGKPSPSPLYPQTTQELSHTANQVPGAENFRAHVSPKQGNHTHTLYIFSAL